MKKLVFLISLMILIPLSIMAQDTEPQKFHLTWALAIAIVTGIYEVVAKLVPTTKVITIIGKLIQFLDWLYNNVLDRGNKTKK